MANLEKPRIKTVSIEDINNPPAPNSTSEAGSIEQHLDMMESGPLRGEEILRSHGARERTNPHPTLNDDQMLSNYRVDMSEEAREGAEESGDEHSTGLQGDEMQELQYDEEFGDSDAGLPGELTNKQARMGDPRRLARKRSAA